MKSSSATASAILLILKQMAKNLSSFPVTRQGEQEVLTSLNQKPLPVETRPARLPTPEHGWVERLVKILGSEFKRVKNLLGNEERLSHYSPSQIESMTIEQLLKLHVEVETLAAEFNAAITGHPELETLHITTVRFSEADTPEAEQGSAQPKQFVRRCRATSQSWSLVLRASSGVIDIFLIPSNELLSLRASETTHRLVVTFTLNPFSELADWQVDLFSVRSGDNSLLIKQLFKELVLKSARQTAIALGKIQPNETDIAVGVLDELYLAKQNMAQKLVSRHEELTHAIARDLHDVVIAEVLLLKRALGNHSLLENEEIGDSLETLSSRLREICYDLAPRDLEDWGLKTIVEDLLERVSKRIGTDFTLDYAEGLPKLALPVELHIYRIIQECLNNIGKYANASKIAVGFALVNGKLVITIADNGTGIATSADRAKGLFERGMGLSTINERTEMIRCFHPAALSINSDPGQGTIVTLEISIFES
ncbi:MAG: hypothetical protein C5B53_04820 [Candidatus Melainabacteria bacterium]|nr:MAG: hypothetical protein C5B53_04820 [Candidatus Melainabacteria bacterium]